MDRIGISYPAAPVETQPQAYSLQYPTAARPAAVPAAR